MTANSNKITALTATVIFHALIILLLLRLSLSYTANSESRQWPPEDTSELLLEGEYVRIGDTPMPQDRTAADASDDSQPLPPAEADDMTNAGTPAESTPPIVSSSQESPLKVKPEPIREESGPSKAEIEAAERARREAETQQRINNRVSFNNSGSTSSGGTAGSPDGNSSTGAVSGEPGVSLGSRTLEDWTSPAGTLTGTITIRVRVNREGRVVAAEFQTGKGAISGDEKARQSCIKAALASKFSVDQNARAEQTGTITYKFE